MFCEALKDVSCSLLIKWLVEVDLTHGSVIAEQYRDGVAAGRAWRRQLLSPSYTGSAATSPKLLGEAKEVSGLNGNIDNFPSVSPVLVLQLCWSNPFQSFCYLLAKIPITNLSVCVIGPV